VLYPQIFPSDTNFATSKPCIHYFSFPIFVSGDLLLKNSIKFKWSNNLPKLVISTGHSKLTKRIRIVKGDLMLISVNILRASSLLLMKECAFVQIYRHFPTEDNVPLHFTASLSLYALLSLIHIQVLGIIPIRVKGYTRVYPKVFGLAAWSVNCKWYNSVPLRAVVSLFCGPV